MQIIVRRTLHTAFTQSSSSHLALKPALILNANNTRRSKSFRSMSNSEKRRYQYAQSQIAIDVLSTRPSLRIPAQIRSSTQRLSAMPETPSKHPLVWIDCEMTGLDIEDDSILSIACFVTDANLNLLDDTGYEAVVHHEISALESMGDWCRQQHTRSGLWESVLSSKTSAEEAAKGCLEYVKKYAPDAGKALLAGNTVHMDKAFLMKTPWTPVIRHLHHRILDVSAIKEAMKRWSPYEIVKGSPAKQGLHEARADILESIAEARYYRERVFMAKPLTTLPSDLESPSKAI